jgi:polyribonucleotide nucleotidyltransferase
MGHNMKEKMEHNIQEDVVSSAVIFIQNSLKALEERAKKASKLLVLPSAKKEFQTLKISLPRRLGNTTVALKLLELLENSILISNTQDSVNNIKQCHEEIFEKCGKNIFTRYTLKKVRRKKYFCVIVDEASYLEDSILEKIYGINSKYFILVG